MTIKIVEDLCKGVNGCGFCIEVCPQNIFNEGDKLNLRGYVIPKIVNVNICLFCKKCELICPEMAINVIKEGNKK